ncbi:MAG: hypothetical protein AB1324_00170 [Candidatus Micrarchaeota archaeon]
MLTHKKGSAQREGRHPDGKKFRKTEIMVEGFVPSAELQERFDIAASHKAVVGYLKERGFRVERCEGFDPRSEFQGGGLSGVPYNACEFDVYTDAADERQARLSTILNTLIRAREYRAKTIVAQYGEEHLESMWVMKEGPMLPESFVRAIAMADEATEVEIRYRFGGEESTALAFKWPCASSAGARSR